MKHLKTLITLFLLVIGTCVSWAQGDETVVPKRTATWDWKGKSPSGIIAETNFNNPQDLEHTKKTGYVHSGDDLASLKLDVDGSNGGSFIGVGAGKVGYALLTPGCKVRVPIRRIDDKVTVLCQSKYNYKIGDVTVKSQTKEYKATAKDAAQGYVQIEAIGDTHFYTISVLQYGFSSVLPVIELNSRGWASFTSLSPEYVLQLPEKAKAYVATAVNPDDGEYGSVTLTEVTTFGYGQGVFVHGPDFDEVFAKVVEVPSTYPTDNELTVGCKIDVALTYESCAYVIATKGDHEEAGFYYVNSDVTVPAGKAFLYAPQMQAKPRRAKGLKITFADGSEATGIESLFVGAEAKTPSVLYNLSGQKVGKDYKGIVIGSDGKKYVK